MSTPWYTKTGTVPAPPDKVWPALLASLHYVPATAVQKILSSNGKKRLWVPLPDEDGGAMAGHVTLKADTAQRSIAISGRWWYRGVFTVDPDPAGSRVRYEIYNAASLATRWAVPLVVRGMDARFTKEMDETLRKTIQHLR
jgi:hypothetical protein